MKKLSQFDNEKPEELESKFDSFDADYLYPTLPLTNLMRIICIQLHLSKTVTSWI